MERLPEADIYEQELEYMPYKESLRVMLDYISQRAPRNGSLLDLMCGPGYLLGKIAEKRKDLELLGVDNDERYIIHSRERYPHIPFEQGDVLIWRPDKLYDVVTCTGALHHIQYEKQEEVVRKMASMVKKDGFVLISDCYIDRYTNDAERKNAAARLGYEYLIATKKNGASEDVIKETRDILYNDVLMKEYKTSFIKRVLIFEKFSKNIDNLKVWPESVSDYGDYISILRMAKG